MLFFYQITLAWRSICQAPIVCALVVLVLAAGVSAFMVNYTSFYQLTFNPLAHKNDRLFMVQTDPFGLNEPFTKTQNQMPSQVSYRDALAFYRSKIATRNTVVIPWGGTLAVFNNERKHILSYAQVVTRDFFPMFEESFLYGGAWEVTADENTQDVAVITEDSNNKLFDGQNSVGKSLFFEGHIYQVVGVTRKNPAIRSHMQNIDRGVDIPESQIYLPLGVVASKEVYAWGPVYCPVDPHDHGDGFDSRLKGACIWLTYWAEFSTGEQKQQFEKFVANYIEQQKLEGHYPRPSHFALSNVDDLFVIIKYNRGDFFVLALFGFGFLGICTLNSIAMLLAKFTRYPGEISIRRAMGATRVTIFAQHLWECLLLGAIGGIIGVLSTYTLLGILQRTYAATAPANGMTVSTFDQLFVPNPYLLLLAVAIAIIASVVAGLYPAWRICRVPVAHHLKEL